MAMPGWIIERSRPIDRVMVTYMSSPKTYTGEDVVEISCHGGSLILKRILELVIMNGARLAQRGEFTKRALLNGKIDLTQAEAVIDLIKARTRQGAEAAAAHLKGSLSMKIGAIRGDLMRLMAQIEASIDFPDEIGGINRQKARKTLIFSVKGIKALISTADIGRIHREGLKVAIIGRPNVGKSSLLNAFLKEERAIVTEEPGTTRDTIEEPINIKGIPVILIDTAGIRASHNKVEMIGVDKAVRAMDRSDIVLLVFDASEILTEDDFDLLRMTKGATRLVALNKTDKPVRLNVGKLRAQAGDMSKIIRISALNGEGIDKLEDGLLRLTAANKVVASNSEVMVNLRQKEALIRADEYLHKAMDSVDKGMQDDFVSIDLKGAIANSGGNNRGGSERGDN